MKLTLPLILIACLALTACSAATQNIPVSSNPDGALVFADGNQVGQTPCNVTLEKTQPHILTFKKDGFHQVDVQISQKYDTTGVTRDAAQSGLSTSSMGANTEGAVANALMTMGADEQSGDAYVLSPSSVVVRLQPIEAQTSQAEGGQAPIVISSDQLAPEDREALVKTTEPATLGSAIENNPTQEAEALLEGAAVAAPTVGTEKEVSHHSHTSTHYNGDGSMKQTSSSSSVKVGVHVNPVEAGLGVLHLLEDAEGGTDQSKE
ncbi:MULTISPECIES: PEGA domain-containing protein [unclassified Pseudodesulfovibrio]|uniref:PEGA domain-containing protein n=1 Tax=unclassified Pseudodesulfovibrio TaxID=2661612 RepID=UPI000FEB879F|nr:MULTISPECIES: PEGA domain-containing protein [unclassified Pseudodesulfovibrio]MCJ2163605.1 PEGA domain-containing protein [Pseudodesulfovibrio sp. S3-i]RWU06837.1 PEGA domain-containing protein [Pseudodesulfovibrio sp. S3]